MAETADPHPGIRLATFFRRNGYVRRSDPARRAEEGQRYKKGDEVRLVAASDSELAEIRALLRRAGIKPARPFRKGNTWRQPVYGVAVVGRLLSMMGER